MENIELSPEEVQAAQQEENQTFAKNRPVKPLFTSEQKNEVYDPAIKKAVEDLEEVIDEFESKYLEYIHPDYRNAYVKNFREYLIELQKLDHKKAREVAEYGKSYARALLDSVYDDTVVKKLLDLHLTKKNKLEAVLNNNAIRLAIFAKGPTPNKGKDPKRFSHGYTPDPETDKKAKKFWYKDIEYIKHQLALSLLDPIQKEKKELAEKEKQKREIIKDSEPRKIFHSENYWDTAGEIKKGNNFTWPDTYKFICKQENELGLENKYSNFESFRKSIPDYLKQKGR